MRRFLAAVYLLALLPFAARAQSVNGLNYPYTASFSALTSSQSATGLVPAGAPSGAYQVSGCVTTTTTGSAGTVTLTLAWNNGASQSVTTSTAALATLGANQCVNLPISIASSTAITWSTTVASAAGSPQYAVNLAALWQGAAATASPDSVSACGNNYGNGVSSVVVTTTCTAAVGGRILAAVELSGGTNDCTDATAGISGLTNSGTALTWVRDVNNSLFQECLYSAYVGTQLNSGGTITATCATSSACQADVHSFYITPSLSSSALDGTGGVTMVNGTGVSPITTTNSGAVSATDICFAFDWVGTQMFTGNFTSSFTTISTNVQFGTNSIWMGYGWNQISTGTPTTSITWAGGSGDYAGGLLACYKE